MAKSWSERLKGGKPAHLETLSKPFGGAMPGSKMLIATPLIVDKYVRSLPFGIAQTVADTRRALAENSGADLCCPISTSIFIRISAEAALEELERGVPLDEVAPF